jgi:RimJ/RimL family protein N-acetyltransferase
MTNRFPHPYTRKDAEHWIGTANTHPSDARHLAILLGDEIVGGAGFERLGGLNTRTAEVGYWVGKPYWGRGIATQAVRLVTGIAFGELDFVRLQARVLEWNPASCRVLEKAGYELEARLRRHGFKDGQICDIWLYALLRPS